MRIFLPGKVILSFLSFLFFLTACGNDPAPKRAEFIPPPITDSTWRDFLTSAVGEDEANKKAGVYFSKGYDFYRFKELWEHLTSIEYLSSDETPKNMELYTPLSALEKCESYFERGEDGHYFVVLHRWYLSQVVFLDSKPKDKTVTTDLFESAEKVSKTEPEFEKVRELYDKIVEKDANLQVSNADWAVYALLQLKTIYEMSPSIDDFNRSFDYFLSLKTTTGEKEYLPATASPVVVSLLTDKVPLDKFQSLHTYLRTLTVRDSAEPLVIFDVTVASLLSKEEKFNLETFKTAYEKLANEKNESGSFVRSHKEAFIKAVKELGIGNDVQPFLAS